VGVPWQTNLHEAFHRFRDAEGYITPDRRAALEGRENGDIQGRLEEGGEVREGRIECRRVKGYEGKPV
jgi:hypothetical protein